ncbi:Nif3-like dinuclear metal center hexameric protein [Companilactobacillus halodurans]|uniref:GTP cyclohydrolase 1 type 2 homolog n=1 Tax=Companilactobacillus halodurans TaxID=2584183 RepID=A0A5P0ZTX2_9LACO|nr:Nif3-like dinuclear metal center hexameric protein [Companilactobacillus halodurans]MQS76043.1 Nif3-like dinuclear metal center hexameric protein [Companilactobacillus halodurans]MQS96479.1 Nif3-like dinuclear metal center hexameric protein [Companilactobacillus halodurans]
MVKVQDIINRIEETAPLSIKMEGDPTGFQLGDRKQDVKTVMTALDVRPNVVQEAIEKKVDLIVAHHPLMFHAAHNLDLASPQNKMYCDLLSHNISVYAAHTNIDKAHDGMNDWLMEELGLENARFIDENDDYSIGRMGQLKEPMDLVDFAKMVRDAFHVQNLRYVKSDLGQKVKNVAIIGGDAGKFYPEVLKAGADTFITGDVYYHTAQDMMANGLNVIDPGHHIEVIFIKEMASILNDWKKSNKFDVDIVQSEVDTEPYNFL